MPQVKQRTGEAGMGLRIGVYFGKDRIGNVCETAGSSHERGRSTITGEARPRQCQAEL